MLISRYTKNYLIIFLAGITLFSCGEMDEEYREFLKDGEKVYTGKPYALEAFSGNTRVKLTWDLISDRKITSAKIFWRNPEQPDGTEPLPGQRNPGRDSVTLSIERANDVDHVEVWVDNLKEGIYTFEVFTYDKNGNSSIRSEVISEVYGQSYQNSIANRPLYKAVYYKHFNNPSSSLDLEWFGVAQQVASVDVKYINTVDQEEKIQVTKVVTVPGKPGVFLDRTILPEYKNETEIWYRTGYLPNETAIDTFYTEYKMISNEEVEQNLSIRPGLYRIIAKHSGKDLKVRNNSTSANGQVEQNEYDHLLVSFLWKVTYNLAGNAIITNSNSGMDMAVAGAALTDGANIQQIVQLHPTPTATNDHDEWTIEAVDDTNQYFKIINRKSGKVIEVQSASLNNGQAVQQRAYTEGAHQQFEFVLVQ